MGSTNFRYCQSETMSSIDLQALWFVSPMQNGASQPLFSKGERRGDKTISPLCKCCTRPRLNSSFTNPRCNLYLETRWSDFPHDENSSGRIVFTLVRATQEVMAYSCQDTMVFSLSVALQNRPQKQQRVRAFSTLPR